jgi:predicted nucleotidyltransferase
MSAITLLSQNRAQILGIARKYGASNVRVFGSVAKGEDKPESDIDLLVSMESGRTLLDLVALDKTSPSCSEEK